MIAGAQVIVNDNVAVPDKPAVFVATTTVLKEPVTVGVPLIKPVDVFNVKPLGKLLPP